MGFLKKNYIIILIFILGIFLRFYQLGLNPPSLNWDETSIGYNAYSVLKTGKDEYGNFLPLSFRSFDDYKPPVYVYSTVPAIAVFGLTEFAVRLPAAFFGSLAVVLVYLLSYEIFSGFSSGNRKLFAIFSSFFLAISPWHLQFSRAAYEGNVGLFFILLGTLLFYYGLKKNLYLILSSFSFILSLYCYHSFRLVIPIYLFVLFVLHHKEIIKFKKSFIISFLVFSLLALPIYLSFLNPQGTGSRLSMVTIFSESDGLRENLQQLQIDQDNGNILGMIFNNRRFYFAREAIKGYFDHWSPNFIFMTGAGSFHHHATNFGMQYLWEFPFMILGAYFLIRNINKKILSVFFLLAIAPLPASITTGTPHGVRAIAMIPGLILLTSAGVIFFSNQIKKFSYKTQILAIIVVCIFLLINFLYYLNQYYVVTPRKYGYFWQFGNKEAVIFARKEGANYQEIIMSYKYDQPYIYYLFYNKIDPRWYQENWKIAGKFDRFYRKIGNYEFRNINFQNDIMLQNALLIATPDEVPEDLDVLNEIKFPDGRVAYKIIKTKK